MDMNSWIVWAILVADVAALVFIGFWFSLRTLRLFTCVTALILAIVVARFGLTHPEYKAGNLVDSFLSGADQVTIALLHPFWPGKVPAPGVAGRWIIAVALLLGYRQLEWWALRWQAPELDLSAIGPGRSADQSPGRPAGRGGRPLHRHDDCPTAGQRQAQLAAELRFRLPTMEVRAPAILPGGARTNALASIAETSGVSGAGMVSAVLRFAAMFWPGPRVIRVRSWVESAEPVRITVLLEDVKTGLPIATKTVAGDSFNEAASMVAGYIARQIFAMDRTVPEWCYGIADGRDLGAMQLVRLERAYAACPRDVADSREEQIDILLSSTGTVRTAGIVRYELAQLLALQGQHLESLRLHALNRELHPRFYRGRYRLAMSLEMITNPEHYLPNDNETRHNLAETLGILSRCGLTDRKLEVGTEYPMEDGSWKVLSTPPPSHEAPCMRVSRELALRLLEIAAKDLGEVRTQLSWWRVVWDVLVRRDERAVWLPHWRRRYRQPFQDGVCAAELFLAIRCRLLEPADNKPGWLMDMRVRWHLRRAIRITSFIAGDPACIHAVLANPHDQWWPANAPETGLDPLPARDRVRWLPWQRSTASWQAAYNTACLYAALADARADAAVAHARAEAARADAVLTDAASAEAVPAEAVLAETASAEAASADAVLAKAVLAAVLGDLEHRVIASLRRVVGNPHSELERPSDWIDSDPDFQAMRHHSQIFAAFENFLLEQKQQEYPEAFMTGKCPVPHTNPPISGRRLTRTQSPILSPVPGPVPRARVKTTSLGLP
jgi:hypothetical protein